MIKHTLLGALLLSLAACVQAADPSPVYVGGGIGHASFKLDCDCAMSSNASGKAFAGYSFGEVPYPGGSFVNSVELVGYSLGADFKRYNDSVRANGIGVVDALSFKFDNVSLTGRLGMGWTRTLDYIPRETAGVMAGLGVSYTLDKHWAVNLDVDRVPTKFVVSGKQKANLVTVGTSYRF